MEPVEPVPATVTPETPPTVAGGTEKKESNESDWSTAREKYNMLVREANAFEEEYNAAKIPEERAARFKKLIEKNDEIAEARKTLDDTPQDLENKLIEEARRAAAKKRASAEQFKKEVESERDPTLKALKVARAEAMEKEALEAEAELVSRERLRRQSGYMRTTAKTAKLVVSGTGKGVGYAVGTPFVGAAYLGYETFRHVAKTGWLVTKILGQLGKDIWNNVSQGNVLMEGEGKSDQYTWGDIWEEWFPKKDKKSS